MTNHYPTDKLVAYDVECYPNYFVVGFKTPDGSYSQFTDYRDIEKAIQNIYAAGYSLAGFNSNNYDDAVLWHYLNTQGDCYDTYLLSFKLINDHVKIWDLNSIDSIDLMPLLPGRMSLKQVGVRMYHPKLQELPINPHNNLSISDMEVIRVYNLNDLDITMGMIHELSGELELRSVMSNEYGVDLRSKGDATIAEIIIGDRVAATSGKTKTRMKAEARSIIVPGAIVSVSPPTWWEDVKRLITPGGWAEYIYADQATRFNVKIPLDDNGRMVKGSLSGTVYLDDRFYSLGVGGCHSVDGPGCYIKQEDEFMCVADIASMYPTTILNQKLFPRHIYEHFGEVYQELVTRRLTAKRAGQKLIAQSLKICSNGAYGKSSDPFSIMFDPSVTAATCVIGQISMLLLTAVLADVNIQTLSSNTDGILIRGGKENYQLMRNICSEWENITGYELEFDNVKGYYQTDVNNYIQVNDDDPPQTQIPRMQ